MSDAGDGSADVPLGALAACDERPAIIEPERGQVSYAALERLAAGVAARLIRAGVQPGERIGLCLGRSTDAIAAMLGALRAGCAYVPVDPGAPAERNAAIHVDCAVRTTLIEAPLADAYDAAVRRRGGRIDLQPLRAVGLGHAIAEWAGSDADPRRRERDAASRPAIACLLYTSGSTGQPKGWQMSRAAVEVFVGWARRRFAIGARDVLVNHAPFTFGMSLLDIYGSLGAGAVVVIAPDAMRPFAHHMADLLTRMRATVFFATPAILSRLGALPDLERRDWAALRIIPFGGEVFPAPLLERLRRRLPHVRYVNCWGSTETNIALSYEIPAGATLTAPPPIGRPCEHYAARVIDDDGADVSPGTVGELALRGEGLTTGYVNQPAWRGERLLPATDGGAPWYRTRDLVVEHATGELHYVGRIGRMVKIRGHRVEPGEIERRLYEHSAIREAAVVAVDGADGLELVAHLAGPVRTTVELKEFCAGTLPAYMVPARFVFHDALPRSGRGKIDFARLRGEAAGTPPPRAARTR
jgi:amino acid adenylation domain-containing protein